MRSFFIGSKILLKKKLGCFHLSYLDIFPSFVIIKGRTMINTYNIAGTDGSVL